MIAHFFYLLLILVIITGSCATSASDILNCVIDKYHQPNTSAGELPNPAKKGEYRYQVVNYGQRPFLFSISKPDIIAPTVNLPRFLENYSRNQGYKYNAYHEFNHKNLPLEAKVWLPLENDPLPLVLLTHGNSAPGFDYLGELLASRGHVVVQVNQTYLNDLRGENGARGWILLEHLNLLRKWNTQKGHSFFGKLDLDNIALVGMSRGGEAVALAASFNQWNNLPNSNYKVNFGFGIKSVIALAPMDGQYQHAHGRNILKNVNYLVLQGGHDADVYQFLGSQQWNRTQFDDHDENYFKQSIYIYRANHINFNENMSDNFHWGSKQDFYSKLLSSEQQEHLTKVFVSAFLEVTLSNKEGYKNILHNPVIHEFELPEDIYVSRHMSSDFKMIEDFESISNTENMFTTLSHKISTKAQSNVAVERLRNGTKTANNILKIDLIQGTETRLNIKLLKAKLLFDKHNLKFNLHFSLAQLDSQDHNGCHSYNLLSDARVEVFDKSVLVYKQGLTNAGSLAPLLVSDFSELEKGDLRYAPTEPVLQTVTIPLELNKPISKESELEIVLIFEPKKAISIIVDDIGITNFI
ncbi:hypothetical protein [Pseudoalteromonas sp. NBT06-2]|uniref:hypothetical protein n=1 Tax=Pseudoalteromonas sp. NBT06-2 TaxID=2025950 RepID=UPI002074B1FC|nr:hypothetical protein [Pseudoalteromonas sp. NBT06-2]